MATNTFTVTFSPAQLQALQEKLAKDLREALLTYPGITRREALIEELLSVYAAYETLAQVTQEDVINAVADLYEYRQSKREKAVNDGPGTT